MEIEIVPGGAEDVDAVAPLWKEMVAHHDAVVARQFPVREPEQSWLMRREQYRGWLADGSGLLLLARGRGAGPVGYAFCRVLPATATATFDFGEVRGDLSSLAVTAAARGSGAGTALVEAARAALRRKGCTYWTVDVVEANTGAVELYRRLGFRPWCRELLGRLDDGRA